jgi:hypothetical protein
MNGNVALGDLGGEGGREVGDREEGRLQLRVNVVDAMIT